uniref:Uncharacterized protein n=1 Tax=Hyaloperonospora arabidopsidis (strain Emoy2) TaxID=559515 RepID=M4C5F7_HYAAE
MDEAPILSRIIRCGSANIRHAGIPTKLSRMSIGIKPNNKRTGTNNQTARTITCIVNMR